MNKFIVEITSVTDRDNLVAEVWFKEHLIAEINQENKELEVEIYSGNDKVQFPLNEFIEALKLAKSKLVS